MNTATTVLRASLAAVRRPLEDTPAALPLADPRGAAVILGSHSAPGDLAEPVLPVVPSARSLFGPRGACAFDDGATFVCDTGHHRLLGWSRRPDADGAPADLLIGQPAFDREGRNARGPAHGATLDVPTGVAACGNALVVADAWNHRVLIWLERPTRSHQPADVVLGQPHLEAVRSNRGADAPAADTLFWPFAVAWDGERLWVADTGNRRVLMWPRLPRRKGEPAALVLGQRDFEHRDENAGAAPGAMSMRWPHGIAFPRGGLAVADAGNNRVMLWRRRPLVHGAPCDRLIGQVDAQHVEHNRADYLPGAASLNMPYGIALHGERLLVADTANSRLVGWSLDVAFGSDGAPAEALAAQPDFGSKGDNRWRAAARDSVCWPYALSVAWGDTLLVADSGNNRVLVWPLAARPRP
jgi:hypothetical protein